MKPPHCAVPGVTVRFVGLPPSEEVVYWVHRCAARSGHGAPLTVVLSGAQGAGGMHEVRLATPGVPPIREHDTDPLLAVRNAFDRLSVQTQPADRRARA